MFAAFCTSAAAAMDFDLNETYAIENKTTNTYNLNYLDSEGELFTTIMAIVMGYFLVIGAIATCRWMITLPRRALATVTALWKDSNPEEAHTPESNEMATQTDDDPLMDDLHDLLQQKLNLETLLDEAQDQVRDCERSNEDLHTIIGDFNHSRQRTIIEAAQQEIYFTASGQAWHANYQCLRSRTTRPIYPTGLGALTVCQCCANHVRRIKPQQVKPAGCVLAIAKCHFFQLLLFTGVNCAPHIHAHSRWTLAFYFSIILAFRPNCPIGSGNALGFELVTTCPATPL